MLLQKGQREARYYNANGFGVCIAARITEGIDWAAYIGADRGYREEDCIQFTLAYGCKLSERDARYYFLDIRLPYRP